ncbi:MAG: 3-dehydroquinate synthase [Chitinophagaceae bacterium]
MAKVEQTQNLSNAERCLFEISDEDFRKLAPPESSIIITDENVARTFASQWKGYRVISFLAGEEYKTSKTLEYLTEALLAADANRQTMLVGIGGGVVTDLVGYLAASFMRGLKCAFVPTTVLAQVDAAIGGKNGVNVGLHKNMLGTIRQPEFIAINSNFLMTLPETEWANGFAEIIKYGLIEDPEILDILDASGLDHFQRNLTEFSFLVKRCVSIKNSIVSRDEFETGERKKLNFGHTVGHALETLYKIPHGHAVGLGMRVAVWLSEIHEDLDEQVGEHLYTLLKQYHLPTEITFDEAAVLHLLMSDKKRTEKGIGFVLLAEKGKAVLKTLGTEDIREGLGILPRRHGGTEFHGENWKREN